MRLAGIRNDFSGMMKFEKRKTLSIVIVVFCSLLFAICAEPLLSIVLGGRLREAGIMQAFAGFSLMNVYRAAIAFFGIVFVLAHFIVKIPVFYDVMYRYRYVLAVAIFLLLVANQIHFSSIGMFEAHIQPGLGSEFSAPIFGTPRAIRSDEWLVSTPIQLAAQFEPDPYGRFNQIVRGAATENMPFGLTFNLATLAFPFSIFYLFGVEYGVSTRWVGLLILTFMVTLEFCHIISRKNRLLAVVGACLVTFSPFFQWWSYVMFIPAGLGTVVCFYHFLNADTRVKKLLFSFGIVVFFSMFIVNLYPAWQVPAGYLFLGIAAWIVADNWEKVRKLDKLDWGNLGLMIILIAAVVGTFLYQSREYIAGISNTVFPGVRHDSGGGIGYGHFINKMMNGGVFAPMTAFRSLLHTNVSEFGGMYTVFPIPILFVSFMMIRKKTIDLLSIILIALTLVLGSYVCFGWPQWLARITLMSSSMSIRAIDIVLFIQLLIFIRAMSWIPGDSEENIINKEHEISEEVEINEEIKTSNGSGKNKICIKAAIGAITVGAVLTAVAVWFGTTTFASPLGSLLIFGVVYYFSFFVGFTAVSYCMFTFLRNKKVFILACIYLICLSGVTWMTIHPIMRGLDAIYSRPLSSAVAELATDQDEKWLSVHGGAGSALLIANGASTINSVNSYPNLELWRVLDPDGAYEHIYNRFAHVAAVLTHEDTSFELLHADQFLLKLSYNDLALAGVRFIHSGDPLDDFGDIRFDLLYEEGGSWIYRVAN